MGQLFDYFFNLARFVAATLEYLLDGLFNDPAYREGFVAGIIFLFVVAGLNGLLNWAVARVTAYHALRQPALNPTPPAAQLGRSCMVAGIALVVLVILFLILIVAVGIMLGLGGG